MWSESIFGNYYIITHYFGNNEQGLLAHPVPGDGYLRPIHVGGQGKNGNCRLYSNSTPVIGN